MPRMMLATTALTLLSLAPAIAVAQAQNQPNAQPAQTQPNAQPTPNQPNNQPATMEPNAQPAATMGNNTQQQPAAGGQQQVAQKCLDDLNALSQQMNKDGYWLTGYRYGSGLTPGLAPAAAPPAAAVGAGAGTAAAPAAGTAAAPAAPVGAAAPVAGAAGPNAGAAPWGAMNWNTDPSYEIRTLYAAASILGQRGDQQGCDAVLGQLHTIYDQYANELRQAGVQPGSVTNWRAQQILAAKPVTELGQSIRVNDITGTDVRNKQDQVLGNVADVIFDPQSGKIAYAIVAHGGFLGLGEDRVLVPWDRFSATPGLNTLVLNVSKDVMDKAPTLKGTDTRNANALQQARAQADQYWQQHQAG